MLKRLDATLGQILHDSARIMFFLFAAIAVIIFRGYQGIAIPHPYSLDYGEAPLVDHAMSMVQGENIYRADLSEPPYTITNYPPLYMALLALSVKLAGPATSFFVGRTISALCGWIAVLCILLILFALTRDRIAALAGAFTFLAFPFVVFWSPLLRIDMLALALSLSGLAALVWKPHARWNFIAAGLLLTAAIYTRQSYALAAPFAAFVFLLARDPKQALRLAGFVGGLSLLLFVLFNLLTDGGFFYNIVTANVNEFRMEQLLESAARVLEIAPIPVVLGAASLLLPLVALAGKGMERYGNPKTKPRWLAIAHDIVNLHGQPLWTLTAPYLIGSVASAVTIGKVGSNVNYLLELCAGLALAAGIVVAWGRAHIRIQAVQAIMLVCVAFGLGRSMHYMMTDFSQDLRDRRASTDQLHQLKDFVAETPGEILADEYMGMLTLLGRPLTIQPFEVTQLAYDGQWDQTPLLESIANQEYAAIILFERPWSRDSRWTPEMADAISQSYRLTAIIAENQVYKPFQPAVATSIDACPRAGWRLPTDSVLGIKWYPGHVEFFGRGNEGSVPVYAIADGLLSRPADSLDVVAILHEDPQDSGKKLWVLYGGMATAGGDSLVADEFPPGAQDLPVKAGQLLGYQGRWSGRPQWPNWMSASLAVELDSGAGVPPTDFSTDRTLDAAPFLGLNVDRENKNLQPLKCEGP